MIMVFDMKKIMKYLIIISFLIGLVYLLIYLFKDHAYNEYSINKYKIYETFNVVENKNYYDFVIKDKDNNIYNFVYINGNKRNKIISDIVEYKEDDIKCIIPVFGKNMGSIYCNNKKEISTIYNIDNEKLINKLKKDNNYNYFSSDKFKKIDNFTYYLDNIPNKYSFLIWNYTGIDIVNDKVKTVKLIDNNDLYNNKYSTLIDSYYLLLDETITNKFLYYDIKRDAVKTIVSEDELSGDYTILGVYNKSLYLIDNHNYNEYVFFFFFFKIELIGSEKENYKVVIDNKVKEVSTSKFKSNMNDYKFIKFISNDKIKEKYKTDHIYLFNNSYYFESNGTFYRSNIKYEDSATKLFSIDKVSDWKIVDNNLLIMSNDTLYLYNDEIGLKKIISNNEFKYNYNNIYNLYID